MALLFSERYISLRDVIYFVHLKINVRLLEISKSPLVITWSLNKHIEIPTKLLLHSLPVTSRPILN